MAEKPAKSNKDIISIEADEALPDGYGLERFMEEINILELEGLYFSANRKGAGKKKTSSREERMIPLRDLAEQPVTVVLSEYGQPGERAYKVLQAAFLKLSEQGPETEGLVLFSLREIARLLGTSAGGKQLQVLYTSIKQLQKTEVICSLKFKERHNDRWQKKWRSVSFSFFARVAFEGSERGRFSRIAIEVDRAIVKNFQNRHVSYFNFERMRGLDMVGMMLYKRFFRHLANIYREGTDRNALKFEKDYEQLVTVWLGLKPEKYKSRIVWQLGKSLDGLKMARLLRDWSVEPKADGTGFKVVGYAGSGFFRDYEDIYRRPLPCPAPRPAEPEPLMLVANFHRQLGHNHDEFPVKEVAYARQLLSRYAPAEIEDLIAFAVAEAQKTNFHMQWFGAVSTYEVRWKAQRAQRHAARAAQAAIVACRFCNEHGFLEFADGSVGLCPHDAARVAVIHAQKPVRGFHQA